MDGAGFDRHELREATLTGVRAVAGARIGIEILVFGASIVLARLISPADFGHAVIALIVIAVAATTAPVTLGSRLVQRHALDAEHAQAASWLALVAGLTLTLVTFALGPIFAAAIFGTETAGLVRLASPAFLLVAFTVTPQALMQRRLDFPRLSRIELAGSAAGAAAGVGAAIAGLGASAIVLGGLAALATTALLSVRAGGFTRPRAQRDAVMDILRFGLPAGFGSLGATTFRNVDYAIVGASLGAAQLGAFWRGYQLGVEYQRKISVVMLRLSFPLYSRTGDIDRIRAIRTRIVRAHATVIYPLLALLVATAPELIPFLYGSEWEPAVLPAQILAISGMTVAAQTGIGPLMMAIGRVRALGVYTWIAIVIYAAAIAAAAPLGLTAVCIAAVGSGTALYLAGVYFLQHRIAGIPVSSLVGELGPALGGCAALLAVSFPLVAALGDDRLPAPVVIAIASVAGLAVYAAVLKALFGAAWADMGVLAGRVLRRGGSARSSADQGPGIAAPAPPVEVGAG